MTTAQDVNRRLTAEFIAQNPVTITLQPRVEVTTATGGRRKDIQPPRAPQVFNLLEPSDSGYRGPVNTSEGRQSSVDFMLLGYWDATIGLNDVFVHDGREYKVDAILHDNGYERRALVVKHGW